MWFSEDYKMIEMRQSTFDHDEIMVVEVIPPKLSFRKDTHKIAVKGKCTVWHFYPSGQNCGTSLEMTFCELWNYARNLRELGDGRFIGKWTKEQLNVFLN